MSLATVTDTSARGFSTHAASTPTLIDGWPIMYRNTLLLFMGGLSDNQIGEMMGVSESAIQGRLGEWIYPRLGVKGVAREKGARIRAFLAALAGGVIPVPQFPLKPDMRSIHLTDGEREVVTLLGLGWSRADILAVRHGSMRSVDEHIDHIHYKFDVHNQVQVMHIAHELGYVSWKSGKPEQVGA